MAEQNLATEKIILAAILKAATEQSTFLIGEFKFEMKRDFKELFRRIDQFVESVEGMVGDDQKEFLASLADRYHQLNKEIRNEIKTIYQTT